MKWYGLSWANSEDLKAFLDDKVARYNRPDFISNDPICIPRRYTKKQDIEITAFFASVLAWGQRKTIINKCNELFARMDGVPYNFVLQHQTTDLKRLLGFKHRTFNDTDLLYFISFLKQHYQKYDSLQQAFLPSVHFNADYLEGMPTGKSKMASSACMYGEITLDFFTVEKALNHFRQYFFSLPDYPYRTVKHISSPKQKSACKRLNMFLRWMVRKDDKGVDFGIWQNIPMSSLICPCDVHVGRVARGLGLISRKQTDWQTALQLTEKLKSLEPSDPVKYDFALFGLGVEEKF